MEKRLLLAFLLMGAVMMLSPYLFKTQQPAPGAKKQETAQTAAQPGSPAAPAPQAQATVGSPARVASGKPASGPPATTQQPLANLAIDTDLFRVQFNNQGATVRGWTLKKFRGNDNKPLELVNSAAEMEFPFSFHITGQDALAKTLNWAYWRQEVDPEGLGVTYTFSDGAGIEAKKTFLFSKNSYLSEVSSEVTVDGKPVTALIEWRGGFGDLTVSTAAANGRALYFNVPDNKLTEQRSGTAKSGPVGTSGDFSFAGLADNYFAAVFLPQSQISIREVTFTDYTKTPFEPKPLGYTGMAVGDGGENRFQVFVGPKDYDQFARINPKLQQMIDWGWMGFLAKPLFLITNWFNNGFVRSYGWSIVLVTIALNMILFPIKLSNMKSMKKMQALKPQIDAIGAKYKNVGLRDPRKAEQNQEVMDLYKKNNVNPMGGCIPMLMQIPFFIAFYKVFTISVEMRGAGWLWVADLSQPERFDIHFLPLIMIVTQFLMQKMTPQPAGDPQQQKMMMFMPLIFGFFFWNLPSGLVLYYMTSNLVAMGQQWFFNHTAVADEAAASVEPPKRRKVRK